MPLRRLLPVVVSLAIALAAGCGGDDDDNGGGGQQGGPANAPANRGGPGGDQAAQAFIDCFKAPGYKAAEPQEGQQSLFSLEANRKGFPNTPVNVTQGQEITAAVFLVFFADEGKAQEALKQVGRSTVGDIPPIQRGPAVIAYSFEDDKAKTEAAVNGCI